MQVSTDVVVVGGGFAGGAMAAVLARNGIDVVMLEQRAEYHDIVRGEWLSPWGIAEAQRLGLDDLLTQAGAWEIRQWVQWDETVPSDEAESSELTGWIPGVGGPLSFQHHAACRTFAESAASSGARVQLGAADIEVVAGPRPRVSYSVDGNRVDVDCKLVVGAGGRSCAVGRQVGVTLQRSSHHWGGGLAVEGMVGWPEDVQAMGTEGDVMYFVFPQGGGRARLYLNYGADIRHRFSGRDATRRFLESFRLSSLPYSDVVLSSRPSGPCANSASMSTWTDTPVREGVVLIGDEAGANDPVLGTGLSNCLRDVRLVSDILGATETWTPDAFRPYVEERRTRLARLQFGSDVLCKLSAEFGPDAAERRKVARARMRENPAFALILLLSVTGPESVAEYCFTDFFVERLLAPPTPREMAELVGARPLAAVPGG